MILQFPEVINLYNKDTRPPTSLFNKLCAARHGHASFMLHELSLATSAYQMISTKPLGIYADLYTDADAVEVGLRWGNSMNKTNADAFVRKLRGTGWRWTRIVYKGTNRVPKKSCIIARTGWYALASPGQGCDYRETLFITFYYDRGFVIKRGSHKIQYPWDIGIPM